MTVPALEGGLALCDAQGWGDVRRILHRDADGGCLTALDPYPPGREIVPRERVLGAVVEPGPPGRLPRLAAAHAFPLWSRLAALQYWARKIREAPDLIGTAADESVSCKYDQQVEAYLAIPGDPGNAREVDFLLRQMPARGSVLVCGCGTGREAIPLAQAGCRVSAFDVLPRMLEACADRARAAGLELDLFRANLAALDLPERRFDLVYLSALVYSFVQGRGRRLQMLRRLGSVLAPHGRIVLSAHVMRRPTELLRALALWLLRVSSRSPGHELGDWFTWFLTPRGEIGRSFSHRFPAARSVLAEMRAAGFRSARQTPGGVFVGSGFH
jgi:SAM-dependent methyltransferase